MDNDKNSDYINRMKLKEKADKNWSCKYFNIFHNIIFI